MNVNSIVANKIPVATRVSATQFNPVLKSQQVNSIFQPDFTSLGNVESPYQTYAAPSAPAAKDVWRIEDYYKVVENEVHETLKAVRCDIEEADFSGMSDVEIYEFIENLFIEAFGENYNMANALDLPNTFTGTLSYSDVGKGFTSALYRHFGAFSNPQEINRRHLYGDMSTKEIQDIISAKYPDSMTNRELYLMLSELDAVNASGGLNGFKLNYSNNALGIIGPVAMSQEEYVSRYTKMLDQQANPGFLAELYNLSTIRGSKELLPATKAALINIFGAFERDDGLLEYNPATILLDTLEKHDHALDK